MKNLLDKELNNEISTYKKATIFFTALNSFSSVLLVFFAYCSKNVINKAVNHQSFTLWAVLLILTGILIPAMRFISGYLVNKYNDEKSAVVRSYIFRIILKKDSLQLNELKNGELLNRLMSDSRSLVTYYSSFIPEVIGDLIQLFGSLILIVFIKPFIGLLILVLGVIAGFAMYFVRVVLKREEKKVMKSYDDLTSFVYEGVENSETLKAVADVDEVTTRLNEKQSFFLKIKKKLRYLSIGSYSIFYLAIQLLSIGLVLYGSSKISSGSMLYGDFAALIELVALFKTPISALTTVGNSLASFDSARDRINKIFSIKNEKEPIDIDPSLIEGIEFRDVSFRYTEKDQTIEGINASIKFGCLTKVGGESGVGKTTLFKIILGIYRPLSGRIILKLKNNKEFDATNYNLYNLFAYVPQSCLVFSCSIFDNLRLANPYISKEDAINALNEVNLSSFSLDYLLKENNNGLSRGEAQRLCIARAIVSKKPFLILDEATASLDEKNAKLILNRLMKRYSTILFASHNGTDCSSSPFKEIDL